MIKDLPCSLVIYAWFSGRPGFAKKAADLFFPPDFADDFPVAMQVGSFMLCK